MSTVLFKVSDSYPKLFSATAMPVERLQFIEYCRRMIRHRYNSLQQQVLHLLYLTAQELHRLVLYATKSSNDPRIKVYELISSQFLIFYRKLRLLSFFKSFSTLLMIFSLILIYFLYSFLLPRSIKTFMLRSL